MGYEKLLFQDTIRINISKNELNEAKLEVVIQVSALVRVLEEHDGVQEESQYLLEAGQFCGIDYIDSSNDPQGTRIADELKSQICDYALERNWKVLPGIIGF